MVQSFAEQVFRRQSPWGKFISHFDICEQRDSTTETNTQKWWTEDKAVIVSIKYSYYPVKTKAIDLF